MGEKAQMQISGRLLSEYFSLPAVHPTKCRLVENKCSRKIFLNRNFNYGYGITDAKNSKFKKQLQMIWMRIHHNPKQNPDFPGLN